MKRNVSQMPVRHRAVLVCAVIFLLGTFSFGFFSLTGGVVVLPAATATVVTTANHAPSSTVTPTTPVPAGHPSTTLTAGRGTDSSPELRRVARWHSTYSFRPPTDEVDCDLVWRTLKSLYEESKLRQAAWREAGHPLPVRAPPGKNVTEIHLLMIGDSWARGSAEAVLRHLDACRMRLPQPLIERDECALQYIMETGGHVTYQLSKAALGLEHAAAAEDAGILRVSIHFHLERYLIVGAQYLDAVLRSQWALPSIVTHSFPRNAQCREHPLTVVAEMEGQMPLCLCEDTLNLDDHFFRRVPVDAIHVCDGLWDTQIQRMEYDLFEFNDRYVDWFFRQERFSPNLSVYPFITWEDNLVRFRRFLRDTYVPAIRALSNLPLTPAGVPKPRVLLSMEPKVNCDAAKFRYMPTLNSSQRCRELSLPLHDVIDDVLLAAYGEPLLGLPRSVPPEWLRLVDYRPLSFTKSAAYRNYTGATIGPGEYLCTMSDGAHFDTHILRASLPPHGVWCARHADQLFWLNLRRNL